MSNLIQTCDASNPNDLLNCSASTIFSFGSGQFSLFTPPAGFGNSPGLPNFLQQPQYSPGIGNFLGRLGNAAVHANSSPGINDFLNIRHQSVNSSDSEVELLRDQTRRYCFYLLSFLVFIIL